ncbi:MAG: PIN domain-containing protein [Deltaproteobacteria bacterium]|nr:PIN domain-containing protein [Deltaproteobacteria bacterium]
MSRVLLDTNILVYAYDRSETAKQLCVIKLLQELTQRHEIVLSAQIMGEFFTVVTRKLIAKLTTEEACMLMQNFSQAWLILPINDVVTTQAARIVIDHSIAYWDAQLLAVAQQNKVKFILSEDLQDGRLFKDVKIINPLSDHFTIEQLV